MGDRLMPQAVLRREQVRRGTPEPTIRDYVIAYRREILADTWKEIGAEFGISQTRARDLAVRNGCEKVHGAPVKVVTRHVTVHHDECLYCKDRGTVDLPMRRCTICDGQHHHFHEFGPAIRIEFIPGVVY